MLAYLNRCLSLVLFLSIISLCTACSQRNPAYGTQDGSVADSGRPPEGGAAADGRLQDDWGPIPPPPPPPPPFDQGAGACQDSTQCPATHYCLFATGCGQDGPGTCTLRPTGGCPEVYFPVCGCDGKDYGNPCEAASAGVSVAHNGTCKVKQTCNDLNNAYVAAVNAAKACAPMLPVVQCQLEVDSALHCGCPTYVEQGNTTAIAAMKKAKQDFQALGCVPYQCGMPCPQVWPGNCAPDASGTSGSCQ